MFLDESLKYTWKQDTPSKECGFNFCSTTESEKELHVWRAPNGVKLGLQVSPSEYFDKFRLHLSPRHFLIRAQIALMELQSRRALVWISEWPNWEGRKVFHKAVEVRVGRCS